MSTTSAAKLFNVDGLVAVITGGGTGIGRFMALALEENGAKVYIIGRRLEVLEKVAKEAKHSNIIPIQGDVTKKADLQKAVDFITQSTGYWKSKARLLSPRTQGAVMADRFRLIHNSTAVFFSVIAFLDLLDRGNKKGNVEQTSQVISTSSIAAYNRVALAGFAYGGTKAATTLLMKQFSTMFIPYGIRSNVIAPGLYPSEMADEAIGQLKGPDGLLPMAVVPAKREGTKEDMAGVILFLASRAGAYLNGTVVVTDGGRLSGLPSAY